MSTINPQITVSNEELELKYNDDVVAQTIVAQTQFDELDKLDKSKSTIYKLKYLKAKKQYYYKS